MTSGNHPDVSIALQFGDISASHAIKYSRIERLVKLILDAENIKWSHVGVIFSTHEYVHNLNLSYLDHDYETDVLSFLIDNTDRGLEGEIYVDVETAIERFEEFDATLQSEFERYVAHGVLHLAGYRDESETEKSLMVALEDKYLTQI